MTDEELMRLLRATDRVEVNEIQNWLDRERAECLSMTRARKLALNPPAATPQEKARIAQCAHCARLVKQMEAGLTHPPLWTLVRWLAGMLEGDESRLMRLHLEEDGCRRCNLLARSPLLKGLVQTLMLDARSVEQVRALTEAAVGVLAVLPAGAEAVRPDGKLTLSVCPSASGELLATVSSSDQGLHGQKMSLELLGEKDTLSREVVLQAESVGGCVGRVQFGSTAELAARLGQDLFALVVPQPELPLKERNTVAPMNEHNAILAAFQAVAMERGEALSVCDRGATRGWTHIHGPSRPPRPGARQCRNHPLDIQKYNGSVNFGQELSERLGGEERPDEPITQHPLGYSHQALSVSRRYGLTTATILARWGNFEKFARDVIIACQDLGIW